MLKTGMIIAERYEIVSKIGTGGMADVYKAMDHKLNRFVAVKVLKPEFREDATFVKKFRSEAQAAAGLTHPNIVNVFDVGDDEGVYSVSYTHLDVYKRQEQEVTGVVYDSRKVTDGSLFILSLIHILCG